jgi:pilus assembly protein CpaB
MIGVRRNLLLLLAALFLGGLATWLTAGWLDRSASATAMPPADAGSGLVRIVVAARDLEPGSVIARDSLVLQPWPRAGLRSEHLLAERVSLASLAGATVRSPVPAGQPLVAANLVRRGEQGALAALISPGRRAISLPVSAASGLSGLVGPGDRVDIILIAAPGDGRRVMGQTVVENVRVLGIDQRLARASAAPSDVDGVPPAPASTVTLEVTPGEAQAVAVAQELGKLTLTLRDLQATAGPAGQVPAHQAPAHQALQTTWDSDVARLPAGLFSTGSGAGISAVGAVTASAARAVQSAELGGSTPMLPGAALAGSTAVETATAIERVNGVEIVRGSSNRGQADAPPPPAPEGPTP